MKCRAAHDLCGGHPYYLAILGYAAAIDHCGRWLTRMALDRIIDRINQGAFWPDESFLDTLPKTVQSDVFYSPVFQTLTRRLPPRPRALAKIILRISPSQP